LRKGKDEKKKEKMKSGREEKDRRQKERNVDNKSNCSKRQRSPAIINIVVVAAIL